MSSRHLRRILEQKEKRLDEHQVEAEADDTFEASKGSSLFPAAAFREDVEEEDEVPEVADDSEIKPEATVKTLRQGKKKPKKKSKNNESTVADEVDEADFEAALRQLQAKQPEHEASANPEAQEEEEWCRLVRPDTDRIDPMAELKKKIGSFQRGSEAADARFANLIERISPRKQSRGSSINVRRKGRNQLIAMQPSWPIVPAQATGLKVDWSQDHDFVMVEHSEGYRNGLSMAIPLIRQADIDGLLILVRNVYPLHVDALLVLSDYVRMSGQSTEASELVEWCLHLLDKSCKGSAGGGGLLSVTKSLADGLPYAFPPNRKVHLALFRHTQSLLRRGCWKTALECGKLLLFWDSSDELFCAPLLVCAALHAGEHEWIQAMAQYCLGSEDELPAYRLLWSAALALSQMLQDASDGESLFVASILSWPELRLALFEAEVDRCHPHRLAMARLFLARMEAILKDQRLTQLRTLAKETPMLETDEPLGEATPFDWVPLYRHVLMSDLTLRVAMPPHFRDLNTYDPISPESVELQRSAPSGLIGALAVRLQNLFR